MLPLTLQPSPPPRRLSGSGPSPARVVFSPSFAGDVFTKTQSKLPSGSIRFGQDNDAKMQPLRDFLDRLAQVQPSDILERCEPSDEAPELDSTRNQSDIRHHQVTFSMGGEPYQMDVRKSAFSIDITIRSAEARPKNEESKVYLHVDSNRLLQFADHSTTGLFQPQPQFPFQDLTFNTPLQQEVFERLLALQDRLLETHPDN